MLSRMSKWIKGFSQDSSSHEILHNVIRQRQAFIIFLKKRFTWRSCRKPSVFPILYLVGFGKPSVHSQVTITASLLLIAGGTISFTSAPAFVVTIVSRNHCRQKKFCPLIVFIPKCKNNGTGTFRRRRIGGDDIWCRPKTPHGFGTTRLALSCCGASSETGMCMLWK